MPQIVPKAYIHLKKFISTDLLKINKLYNLGFNRNNINKLKEFFLVVDANYQIKEVVYKEEAEFGEVYGRFIIEEKTDGVVLRSQDPIQSFLSELPAAGIDINKLRERIDQQDNLKAKDYEIEVDPLQNILASKGIQFVASNELSKVEVRRTSLVIASNVVRHIPEAERAHFFDEVRMALKKMGFLLSKTNLEVL